MYQQIVLDDESSLLTTINMPRDLFNYKRLPFGIAAVPSIFQCTIENLLQGVPKVCVYIDDVLVTGTTEQEHLENLTEVLCQMSAAGMRLKREKCEFMLTNVHYLVHSVSSEAIRPTDEKIRAIRDAPEPKNLQQLCTFIRLLNFYAKFLTSLSTVLAPLYSLLQKD